MAYQVGTTCYSSALMANQATASSIAGTVVLVGAQSHIITVQSVDAVSFTLGYTPLDGGVMSTVSVPNYPQPCNLFDTADGVMLGWAIAAVWLATAAVLFLRRGVHE